MRYVVRKSIIEVLGVIWMPSVECGQLLTLSGYDVENAKDDEGRLTRESVEHYRGHYTSEEAFAEELAEECYGKELGPMASYIDYEKYAHDLFMGDLFSVDGDGGVWVFWNT
jgi:antirestriction protein